MLLPPQIDQTTNADIIELNIIYNEKGVYLKQWIVWDWCYGGHHVRDWIPVTKNTIFRYRKNGCELTYISENKIWRVKAKQFRRVTSLEDREVKDRKNLPTHYRNRIWHLHSIP